MKKKKSNLGTNPKDLFGLVKVSISKFPAVAILHGAHAMMDGARKYGPYNWRKKKVIASVYVDACARHLFKWFERIGLDKDSGAHELGHAMACIAILLDAEATGNLIDDRPPGGVFLDLVLDRLSAQIQEKAAERLKAERRRERQKKARRRDLGRRPTSGRKTPAKRLGASRKRA